MTSEDLQKRAERIVLSILAIDPNDEEFHFSQELQTKCLRILGYH